VSPSKVELYAAIRRDARAGMSGRAIEKKHGVGRRTVGKALASAWPEQRKQLPPRASKLDPFKPVIDEILKADLDAPRKQRHTITRIWRRLMDEHQMADVSYPVVRAYVAERKPQVRAEAGRYLAEAPLSEQEAARLAGLPEGVPGEPGREQLNLWYLSDAGQAELLEALRSGRYRVEVPEEAALGVAVLLLDLGFPGQALDLMAELRPLMHRLRFTPRFEPAPRPSGTAVRLEPAGKAAQSLRAVRTPPQLTAMRETLGMWNPLYDRLVALWCSTVDGELPFLDEAGTVRGGWPCRRWPDDWAYRRANWVPDHERACQDRKPAGRHARPRSNFTRLHAALRACPDSSGALSVREAGRVRRALAGTVTRHGAPRIRRARRAAGSPGRRRRGPRPRRARPGRGPAARSLPRRRRPPQPRPGHRSRVRGRRRRRRRPRRHADPGAPPAQGGPGPGSAPGRADPPRRHHLRGRPRGGAAAADLPPDGAC
jgi:hypothetical protein